MKYLAFFLFSILPFVGFSQANFQKGYIITAKGDTLSGYIDYKEWTNSPQKISFKALNINQQPQIYLPADIIGFAVNGFESYRGYHGLVTTAPNQGTNFPIGIDSIPANITAFVKVLVNAKPLSLYAYTDDVKTRYLIQENGNQPEELRYDVFYNPKKENFVIKSEGYKRQLITLTVKYASSNQDLINKIGGINYSQVAIKKIVEEIDNKPVVKLTKSQGMRLFVAAGANYSTTKFSGADILSNSKAGRSTTPVFGFGADLFNNSYLQKFIFRAEVDFSLITPDFYVTGVGYADSYSASIKQYNLTVLPQVIYNFYNKENLKIYAGIGFGANFSSYHNKKTIVTGGNTIMDNDAYNFSTFWAKYTAEGGLVLSRRVEIFARYFPPISFSGNTVFNVATTEYQFGLHYLFGKKN